MRTAVVVVALIATFETATCFEYTINVVQHSEIKHALHSFSSALLDSPEYTSYTRAIAAALPTTYNVATLPGPSLPAPTARTSAVLHEWFHNPSAIVSAEIPPPWVLDLPSNVKQTVYIPFEISLAAAQVSIIAPHMSGAAGSFAGGAAVLAALGVAIGVVAIVL